MKLVQRSLILGMILALVILTFIAQPAKAKANDVVRLETGRWEGVIKLNVSRKTNQKVSANGTTFTQTEVARVYTDEGLISFSVLPDTSGILIVKTTVDLGAMDGYDDWWTTASSPEGSCDITNLVEGTFFTLPSHGMWVNNPGTTYPITFTGVWAEPTFSEKCRLAAASGPMDPSWGVTNLKGFKQYLTPLEIIAPQQPSLDPTIVQSHCKFDNPIWGKTYPEPGGQMINTINQCYWIAFKDQTKPIGWKQ